MAEAKSQFIRFRVSNTEKELIEKAAKIYGYELSDYARKILIKDAVTIINALQERTNSPKTEYSA